MTARSDTRRYGDTMAKVLLIAPSCDGTDVGEAWVAHQWAWGMSQRHELTVLSYRGPGRPSTARQLPQARVVEWDQPALLSRTPRFNSLLKPWYPLFYRHCRRWIATALANGEHFDLGHQPVPVAMRYPSPLTGWGMPYVLGPVGGSLPSPPGFDDEDTAPWYVGLRRLDRWRMQHDPVLRRSYEQASIVLGIAPYVAEHLRTLDLADLRYLSETAVAGLPEPHDRGGRTGTVRLLYVGRLIRTKGARDAIGAMADLADLDVTLDIVGDGFDRAACESLVSELDLSSRVTFHGAQPRDRVEDFYRASDVFIFPSFREPGGNVHFEAMAHGLPLVISDRGGPASVVTDAMGIKVTPRGPGQYPHDLALAVRELVTDHTRRREMGRAARAFAEAHGTWTNRLDQMDDVYQAALAVRA